MDKETISLHFFQIASAEENKSFGSNIRFLVYLKYYTTNKVDDHEH